MGEKPELLPCPFCGGEAEAIELWGAVDMPTAMIECACHASVQFEAVSWNHPVKQHMKKAMAKAIAAWNRRVPPPSSSMGERG